MSRYVKEVEVRPVGCFSIVITAIICWALIFGVTYEGHYYGLSCSCEKGVEVHK